VFWTRNRREARRQQVLDELLALGPNERRVRLDVAVEAGDVRADEVESALLLVHRLDVLRVMTVPPSGRLPGGIVPVVEHRLRDVESAAEQAARPASGGGKVAVATRSGRRSSHRRRRARMTADLPVMVQVEVEVEVEAAPQAPENWPSIEWLRP
jgi:hypothetical protein